jgi:hypothetical protein
MTKDMDCSKLVERLRTSEGDWGHTMDQAADAIESLTRRVSDLEGDLMAKNSALGELNDEYNVLRNQSRAVEAERDALRQELEAVKGQEPVGYVPIKDIKELADPRIAAIGTAINKKPAESRAAIYLAPVAPAQAQVPEGWKLVPVEPTELMVLDGGQAHAGQYGATYSDCSAAHHIYDAMLSAAPLPPAPTKENNQ